jgi:mono/diheme cytochrome c family protein
VNSLEKLRGKNFVACLAFMSVAAIGDWAFAANEAEKLVETKAVDTGYQNQVRKMLPVAYWTFDAGAPDIGEVEGKLAFGKPGPTAEDFRSFQKGNEAVEFGAGGNYIVVEDPGDGSQFDFDNGDPITIEAWVKPGKIGKNENTYIIGKGRTGNAGFEANNQNFALRLWEKDGKLRISFLFRSRPDGAHKGDWHRWTSISGIEPEAGWHHVAVSYRFGNPESVRGYIDAEQVEGTWDMGGKTTHAPVVDDDEVWLGTTLRGSASNTFKGLMDEVAVYRRELTKEQIAQRYPVVPYVPVVDEQQLTSGKVKVEILENLDRISKWPRRFPDAEDVYEEDVFGFFHLPQKYNERGIREDRSNPFVLRASAGVVLPKGEHRILLRSRGKGRLWLDGEVIAETVGVQRSSLGAHGHVSDATTVDAPGLRYLGPGDHEIAVPVVGDGKRHAVVFEMIAGNGSVRTTLGETSVSLETADGLFVMLSPGEREVPLTDEGWVAYRNERSSYYLQLDAQNRAAKRKQSGEDDYWRKRHAAAREFVTAKGAEKSPAAGNPIDALLQASWKKHNAEAVAAKVAGGIDYEKQIKPILAENCYRCHDEKTKGGLKLSDRESVLAGGDSEIPAIVPGKPGESFLLELIHPKEAGEDIMPPKGEPLPEQDRKLIAEWISQGASFVGAADQIEPTDLTSDLEFLRRATLDTVGVVPSAEEIANFENDPAEKRRSLAIDRLLDDPRWADNWTAYWQDVLAENPNILKPSLNNTGPFRFWIHEALSDNKAMDRFVTELVMMEGSAYGGGTAGFGMASQNDVPMAAKAHVLGTAFLGVEMKCARCHDSPYHETVQRDLFEIAAMLKRETITLPGSSTVPASTFEGREPLIEITLKPGEEIAPQWPFEDLAPTKVDDAMLRDPGDARERLAATITAPQNERFAQVIVNRLWKQLIGHGFVDPVDDWEASQPSHPGLLTMLGEELVANSYDFKHIARLIMNSEAYQRKARALKPGATPDFSAPIPRRMSAEQVVDSLFSAVGKKLDSEELTFDMDGTQVEKAMISLGYPRRAWEFTSLSNERDRPSLAIPKAQVIVDVLENFGWRSSRQEPKSVRETDPNVRQPAILANGALGRWVTTLSDDSGITALALREDLTMDELVEQVFLRLLTRKPTADERVAVAELLSEGFADRVIPEAQRPDAVKLASLKHVSWSNHLSAEANSIKIEMEKRAREGMPPTVALQSGWRERLEDVLWATLNSPEFVFLP